MNPVSVRCPECNGPQDLSNVAKKEWKCEYCSNTLMVDDKQTITVVPITKNTPTNNKATDITNNVELTSYFPENPLFTAMSVLYLLIVGAAIICSIFKFVENQTVLIVIGLTVSTNLYIGISGFAIAKSDQNKAPEPSNPTTLAVFVWLIVNILLMVVGFPVAILTRIIATFLYFVVGLIIGSIEVNPPQKQKQ